MVTTLRIAAVVLLLSALHACRAPRPAESPLSAEPPSFDFVQEESPEDPSFWAPTPDAGAKYDWIKLKSGEWLKGRLDVMRDNELEFDSEELEDQTFDWEDVHEVRSPNRLSVRLDDETVAVGPVWIRDGKVHVAGETPRTFERDELFSLTPEGQKEISHWKGKLTIGYSEDSGNQDELDAFASGFLRREDEIRRLRFDYFGEYDEVDGGKISNNHRFTAKVDRYVSSKLYISPIWIDFYADEFQNIEYRVTPSVGVGYSIFRRPRVDWDVELSGGYQYLQFDSVEAGEDDAEENGSVSFGTYIDVEVTDDIDFILKYEFQGDVQDLARNFQNTVGTISKDIGKNIDFDISLTWERVGLPEAGSDGVTPDKDDFNVTIGIGFEL